MHAGPAANTAAEAAESLSVLETCRIRHQLESEAPGAMERLRRHVFRKRTEEVFIFVSLAAIGVSISAWARSIASLPILFIGIVVTAIASNTFPLLMHEGMHGVLVPSRFWNWALSVLLGATFLMSFSAYRVLHLRHHRYLGDPRDPDDYHNYTRRRSIVWLLHFVRLAIGAPLYILLIPPIALRYGSVAERRLICAEYVILLGVCGALLRSFSVPTLLTLWIVPTLLMGIFVAVRGFTQHGITDASDPYLAARTMLPSPVIAFFLLYENYHLEHHLFPEVPSYNLPRLHDLIWPKLPRAISGRSYLAFLAAFLKAARRMDESPIGLTAPGQLR
jgi:fatty acid desaturase